MSRRSTAPLEAVILPDLPPPRGSRWRVVLVGAAFLACLAIIVGVMWGIATLATTARRQASDSASLVDHWEEPAERLANLKRAMSSREVAASAAELRDFYRLLTRITNACRSNDRDAFLACIDLNLMVRRISQHPLVRDDRSFSPWMIKSELEAGLSPFEQVGEFSIVRVEKGQTDDLAVVYTVDWDYSLATACRWWLVRDGRNWRLFDWERLDLEQSLAHTWAIRDAIAKDPHQYNYTVLRGAIDSTPHVPGGRTWGPRRPAGADLASLIDDPLPEAVHDAAMFDLAWALIGQGRPSDAIKAANALQRPQDHPGYLIIRARAYSDLDRYELALADTQEYERIAGPDPLVLDQAATALANLDRHREAAECWLAMLRLAPNHDEALSNFCRLADADQQKGLGEILIATRQPIESAVAQAQNAVYEDDLELFGQLADFVAKAVPDSPAAIAIQAQRLAYEGQHEQAAARFQRAAAAEFRPDKKVHYFNQYLDAMRRAGKIAEGYAAASDPQAAFNYLTAGYEEDEAELSDAQLKELLAKHEKRVPGDGRADFLAGQLLMRDEEYALAEAKFQAAIDKAEDDEDGHYRNSRIEALYRLGRGGDAYEQLGRTPEVFRELARHMEEDGNWDELRALIQQHRTMHSGDRWIDYYEARDHREQGQTASALAALARAELGDEQLKAACGWMKRSLLIEAGTLDELFDSADDRRQLFLDVARELTQSENWITLNKVYKKQQPFLGVDADVLNAWTEALFQQGRLEEAADALRGPRQFASPPLPHVERELAMREVRCWLRLNKLRDARKAAERATSELNLTVPLVMVLLAEENLAGVREQLNDPVVVKGLLEQPIDQDPELVQLLLHPDLADVRSKLTLPLTNYAAPFDDRLILLLREPLTLSAEQLSERLSRSSSSPATVKAIEPEADSQRQSFRVEQGEHTVLLTLGAGPYWKPGRYNRPPRDAAVASALHQHRGYVVLESDRSRLQPGREETAKWLRQLAAELCGEGALAVNGRRHSSSDWRLVARDEALVAELGRGEFLNERPRAGVSFALSDTLRYPEAESASGAEIARRRAATQLARQVHAGAKSTAQVRAEMWRGHARESLWLDVVAARRDSYGRWQLIGELTEGSAARPALAKGTRIVLQPYEVLEIREGQRD